MMTNRVKAALKSGKVQIGTWVTALHSPQLPQILASAGFDFIYIDMEHSSLSIETVSDLCCAALAHDLIPIVRPPAKEPHLLRRPLDAGAMGLLVPHVDTAQDAMKAVRAVKYPPLGERGFDLQNVHTRFVGADAEEYARAANEESLLIVQIESRRGIRNLDAILSVDGVDGAVVGRGDLSADLGLMGQPKHREVTRRVEMMVRACHRRGKVAGLLVQDVQSARHWIDKGIRLVPFSNEVTMLMAAAVAAIGELRAYGVSAITSLTKVALCPQREILCTEGTQWESSVSMRDAASLSTCCTGGVALRRPPRRAPSYLRGNAGNWLTMLWHTEPRRIS